MTRGGGILALAWIALAAGCASKAAKPSVVTKGAEDGVSLGVLADSAIPKGDCGMVLWALENDHPSPVFRYLVGKKADVVLGKSPAQLERAETEGASGFGVYEHQSFVDGAGLSLVIDAKFGLQFDGGSYLEKGVIIVEAPGGWRTVVPVAGLAGCRP